MSSTLKEAREGFAAALQAVNGPIPLRIKSRPVKGNLRQGDGWVVVGGDATPSEFARSYDAILTGWLILGSDETKADELVDELTIPLIDAAVGFDGRDVACRPSAITGGEGVPGLLYALSVTATVEITS
jgi:hypothetical protein